MGFCRAYLGLRRKSHWSWFMFQLWETESQTPQCIQQENIAVRIVLDSPVLTSWSAMPYLFSFIHNALITSGTPSTCAGLRLDMEEIVEYYISSTVASWTSNAVPERWRHPSTTPPIVLAPTTSVEPLQQMITWSHVTTSIAHLFLTGKIQFLYTFPSKVISTRNEIISYFIPKILVWYYLPIHKKKIKKVLINLDPISTTTLIGNWSVCRWKIYY